MINTRQDLDALKGTQAHTNFIALLKGSMTRKQDMQNYPNSYGLLDYTGPILEPVWQDVEDLSIITHFGFTKDQINALL